MFATESVDLSYTPLSSHTKKALKNGIRSFHTGAQHEKNSVNNKSASSVVRPLWEKHFARFLHLCKAERWGGRAVHQRGGPVPLKN